ncbi:MULTISPECIES: YkvA family protein [unclassified Pseudofrankia]|uniref:YkvA family protein n=1 Tax=unclassified Pseudofrankia TaxID=2994372 RepID=UPI0009F451D0|nr:MULTISPECIES: YkvA family protein [unclassified Pseudofrankia]MDT3445056.1 YkvA family protein [Pseudofrankia sp. BMG5.37]
MDHDTFSTVALVILTVFGLVALALAGAGAYVLVKYRVPLRGVVTAVGALAYLVSPVDAVPEALFGPFGLVDDGGVLLAAALYVARLVAARRAAAPDSVIDGEVVHDTRRTPRDRRRIGS